MSWHRNPDFSMWPGKVPGRVTLCSRCYQCGYRAHCKGRVPKLPKYEHTPSDTTCPPPGTSIANCLKDPTPMLINKPLGVPVLLETPVLPDAPMLKIAAAATVAKPLPVQSRPLHISKGPTSGVFVEADPVLPPPDGRTLRSSTSAASIVLRPRATITATISHDTRQRVQPCRSNSILEPTLVPSSHLKAASINDDTDMHFSSACRHDQTAASSRINIFPHRGLVPSSHCFCKVHSFWGKFLTTAHNGRIERPNSDPVFVSDASCFHIFEDEATSILPQMKRARSCKPSEAPRDYITSHAERQTRTALVAITSDATVGTNAPT